MNCNNTNQTMGFDNFAECDYNLHWSFSNFNRMLMAAGHIARLPRNAIVLELGAGTSELSTYVSKNFKRDDIKFVKVDSDIKYKSDESITILNITCESDWDMIEYCDGEVDCVVLMEVIEHIDKQCVDNVFKKITRWLKPEGIMLFTTPTPPHEGMYENEVWPLDHDEEFTYSEIYDIINQRFKINKSIGWSLEEREYNRLIEADPMIMKIYGKLREAFPESYIRSIIACLSLTSNNRQVFMVCKKRRTPNGVGPEKYD